MSIRRVDRKQQGGSESRVARARQQLQRSQSPPACQCQSRAAASERSSARPGNRRPRSLRDDDETQRTQQRRESDRHRNNVICGHMCADKNTQTTTRQLNIVQRHEARVCLSRTDDDVAVRFHFEQDVLQKTHNYDQDVAKPRSVKAGVP
jgi:hypothetical protein